MDKPAGMKTHPNEPTENSTLLNHLAAYLDTKKQRPCCPPFGQRNKRRCFICVKPICLADTWKNVGTKNQLLIGDIKPSMGKIAKDRTITNKITSIAMIGENGLVDDKNGHTTP